MKVKIKTLDGKTIVRLSRWIKIRTDVVTSRHCLYDYAIDGCGRINGSSNFDPEGGVCVTYFIWNGKKWALEQFGKLSYPIFYEDAEGKHQYLSGYDMTMWHKPILIEFDECCEYVRVYEEIEEGGE